MPTRNILERRHPCRRCAGILARILCYEPAKVPVDRGQDACAPLKQHRFGHRQVFLIRNLDIPCAAFDDSYGNA
jgi:hypothetical protein